MLLTGLRRSRVGHQHRQRQTAAVGASDLLFEAPVEFTLVQETREPVADGRLAQGLVSPGDLAGHIVEGLSKLVDLVTLDRRHLDVTLEIAAGDRVRRGGRELNGLTT